MSSIVEELIQALGKKAVLTHEAAAERFASVWANENLNVKALLLPSNTEEVMTAMRICYANDQPVVPHGGLTNIPESAKTGPDEIAISLERMNRIEEIDTSSRTARVQAGVILQQLQAAAKEADLLFPLDFGSRGSCMIGGNIATNAGGLQVFRYGTTRQLVLGLEVVLADGTLISSLDKMIKNNAGYDLKQLFIGSEGTLGIITRAVVKLVPRPTSRKTAYAGISSFDKVVTFLNFASQQLAGTLTTFEVIWKDYYQLMTSPPSSFQPPLPQD